MDIDSSYLKVHNGNLDNTYCIMSSQNFPVTVEVTSRLRFNFQSRGKAISDLGPYVMQIKPTGDPSITFVSFTDSSVVRTILDKPGFIQLL